MWLYEGDDDYDPEYGDLYVPCPDVCDACVTQCDRWMHADGNHEHAIDEEGVPEGYVHHWSTPVCPNCGDGYCTGCRWPVDVVLAPDYKPLF